MRLLIGLLFCLPSWALIFPLNPEAGEEYDAEFNALHSYREVWRTNQHALLNIGAQNGVAIAPRWLLTAWHVVKDMDETWWANDDTTRYYYREKVDLGNDLALVRVDKPFPVYSQLQKFAGGADDIMTVYGQSAAAREPIVDRNGVIRGWKFPPLTNHPALRWGRGRRLLTPVSTIQWEFTTGDMALGNGGLNCVAVATNDSGGGIFVGRQVVGVIKGLLTTGFRESPDDPLTAACELNPLGFLFDGSQFVRCNTVGRPYTRAFGSPVYPALSNILARISPPRRVNAGGQRVEENGRVWEADIECSGCASYADDSTLPVSTAGLGQPAPQTVYRSALYKTSDSGGMTLVLPELIKYEKYNVRLHFASIFPAEAPGACNQLVTINGTAKLFDPYTGVRRGAILEFQDVSPSEQSGITVTIEARNPGGNVAISGIEVAMVPLTPVGAENASWDYKMFYPIWPTEPGGVFGRGLFVGRVMSTDDARTWQWLDNGLDSTEEMVFGADRFVARGEIDGEAAVSVSEDGREWIASRLDSGVRLSSIAYGKNLFVALGTRGAERLILNSRDGEQWEPVATLSGYKVVFGNERFLVVDSVRKSFFSSIDGWNWSHFAPQFPPPEPGCTADCPTWWFFNDIIGGGTEFVTYAIPSIKAPDHFRLHTYRGRILSSKDGEHWIAQGGDVLSPFANSNLFFLNNSYVYFPNRTFSTDLINWHSFNLPTLPDEMESPFDKPESLWPMFGDPTHVIFGFLGHRRALDRPLFRGGELTSLERIDYPTNSRPSVAVRGRTTLIVNSYPGYPFPLLVSTNSGAAFATTDLPAESSGLLAVHDAEGQFVTVGKQGRIVWSSDGVRWGKASSATTNDLSGITFGNGRWVAVGADGAIITSTTGRDFSAAPSGTTRSLRSVTFGAAGFVAGGDDGTVVRSMDGVSWTAGSAGAVHLSTITFGAGQYLAATTNGLVYASRDGVEWSSSRPTSASSGDIAFADGMFILLDGAKPPNAPKAYLTIDGVTWADFKLPVGTVSLNASEDAFWFVGSTNNVRFAGRIRLNKPDISLRSEVTENGALGLTFDAPLEGSYSILSTTDLSEATWQTDAVLTRRKSDQMEWVVTNRSERALFYQVRHSP